MPRLDTIASFLPDLVVRRGGDLAGAPLPIVDRGPAAVLFADISGFTSLAERLTRRGPGGVEELTRIINAYFERLIAPISAHGGDIVKFAGDALLALWPAGPGGLEDAVLRAAAAALAVREAAAGFAGAPGAPALAEGESPLSLRTAVAAGEVTTAHVGGERARRELFVAGPPLVQVAAASALARPGRVVLSPEARRAAGAGVAGTNLEGGALQLEAAPGAPPPVPLEPAPVAEAAVGALLHYLPAAIRQRLDGDGTGWLAEVRRLTVLFVNLADLDHARPASLVQETIAALQREVYRFEGSVNKLSVDDKGATLVAAFGLPPLAHEDDAARGVQAALAIRAALERTSLASAVGVTTGRAFCGIVGSARRREYTIMGAVVNLAARLMQASRSEGGILCDPVTAAASVGRIEFEADLRPLSLKGVGRPIAAARPRGVREGGTGRWAAARSLVGRGAERVEALALLDALLAQDPSEPAGNSSSAAPGRDSGGDSGIFRASLVAGDAAAAAARAAAGLSVEGDAGLGKSRLLGEVLGLARRCRATVLSGAGSATERATPYLAWRPVVRGLLGLEGLGGDAARERALSRLAAIGGEAPALAPLLDEVLPLCLPGSELTTGLAGDARAGNTRRLLALLVDDAASRAPLVLAFDDAQWMDSASWAALLVAFDTARRGLFAVACRSGEEAPEHALLLARPAVRRLRLGPLSGDETVALARLCLGGAEMPRPLARFFSERAHGNPLYVEELAASLVERGLVRTAGGRCELDAGAGEDLEHVRLPETLEGLVTSRIDRLPASAQLSLKAASAIGLHFTEGFLADIYPIEAERAGVPGALLEIMRSRLTEPDHERQEVAYAFRESVTREVAYNLMPEEQRRRLHRAIALSWERRGGAESPSLYPVLARHWALADDVPRAIEALERAGEAAMRSFALREAARFFEEALSLAARREAGAIDPLRRARWRRQLGEACFAGAGDMARSRAHLEAALAALGRPEPSSALRRASRLAREALVQLAHLALPARLLGRSEGTDREARLEAVRAHEVLAQIHFFGQRQAESMHSTLASLNLAATCGASADLARALTRCMLAASLVGAGPLVRRYSREALRVAAEDGQPATLGYVHELIAAQQAGLGRLRNAAQGFARAAELFLSVGDLRHRDECTSNLAIVRHQQGRLDESARLFRDVETKAARRGDPQAEAWGHLGVARNHLPAGALEEALASLDRARRLLDQRRSVADTAACSEERALRAGAVLRLGRRGEAASLAGEAQALLEVGPPVTYYTSHVHAATCEVLVRLLGAALPEGAGERGALEALAARAVAGMRAHARVFPVGAAAAATWAGALDLLRGSGRRARRSFASAIAAASREDALPHDAALARVESARGMPAGDPSRAALLREAAAEFRLIGAAWDEGEALRLAAT